MLASDMTATCRPSMTGSCVPTHLAPIVNRNKASGRRLRCSKRAAVSRKGRDNIGIIEEEDDQDVVQQTFRQAYQNSQPQTVCVPGLQEFAGAIWDRRKNIASGTDPLDHIFTEFDHDNDGFLNAEDVYSALRSRNVDITHEQAQMFLEVSDVDHDHKVGRHEFAHFIFHMAAADLVHQDITPEVTGTHDFQGAASIDEQETVSHAVEAGNLAGGLQAWLRLTNNTEMFGSEDTCVPEDSST